MPIPLRCPCGRPFRIKGEMAGKKIRCPYCAAVLLVPAPEAERGAEDEALDFLLTEPSGEEGPERSAVRAEPPPAPPPDPVARAPLPPARSAPRKVLAYREEPGEERRAPRAAFEEGWFGNVNAGMFGGLLMMLIAVVWFVVGLAAGIIFFYPPILLVIGLVAFVKGMMGRD